jgi:glycosyltransferase involved in cell wall biosynthesis
MNIPKRILYLTTLNLATNPRLVKEIRLALDNSFSVEVICFEFENWSKENNEKLKKELANVKFITIPAGRKPFLPWVLSVVKEQMCRKLVLLFKSEKILANAVSRRSSLVIKNLNKVSKPDWVIGHNPGALRAAKFAAEKFTCGAGFDVEDYHPGEGSNVFLQNLSRKLMQRVLPKMNYVSFAAPLIMEEVKKEATAGNKNWFTVLNLFPSAEFCRPGNTNTGKLKLVWFSQNISFGRGLDQLITVIKCNPGIVLHLFGNCNESFRSQWLFGSDNIYLHSSLPQSELHWLLAKYVVGLSLEENENNLNRNLCLTNKILAYYQSGLYILASKTKAQERFIKENPDHGMLTSLSSGDLIQTIQKLVEQKESLRKLSPERYENAKEYGWEKESAKLVEIWKEYH